MLICWTLVQDVQSKYFVKLRDKNNTYFTLLAQNIGEEKALYYKNIPNQWEILNLDLVQGEDEKNNQVEILGDQYHTFSYILDEISKAKHHIHLEYFIVRNDRIGEKLKNLLIEKSKAGVEVRFIYDGFGSYLIGRKYIRELEEAGVQLSKFSPISQSFRYFNLNHRNHRKILLVDGETAVIGGSNIGDEYLGRDKDIGKWRDMDILIRGDAVKELQAVFLRDWYISKGEVVADRTYFMGKTIIEGGPIKIIAGDPPITEVNSMEHFYLTTIYNAKDYLYFTTPYLIPPDSILLALESVAARGVRIRILISDRSDNILGEYATNLYAKKLAQAGIEVYRYMDGFLHSKVVVVDGKVATIGTPNLDHRGLRLDYEVLAAVYHKDTVKLIEGFLSKDLEKAHLMEENIKLSFIERLGYTLVRMIRGIL